MQYISTALILSLLQMISENALASELGVAISKKHTYGCVPYIENPRAEGYPIYFKRSEWDQRTGTFQCYYSFPNGEEYVPSEGRLLIPDSIKRNNCKYDKENSKLRCEGKH